MAPGNSVLLFDDGADHAGMQAAEVIAKAGSTLELMTPDRTVAADVMGVNITPYMQELMPFDVQYSMGKRLEGVTTERNKLKANIGSDYLDSLKQEKEYDQIVVNHGTTPLDDLYFELLPHSSNAGEVDYDNLIANEPQTNHKNEAGQFQLFRIGDAVSSRNIHAAVFDGLRYCRTL